MPAIPAITSVKNPLKGRFGNARKGKCTGGTGTIGYKYKDGTQTVRFEDTLTADCGGKSLRLRSNESPSGAFEQQNGLVQARWRGLAPTSSDLSSSAGPELFSLSTEELFCYIWSFCKQQSRSLLGGLRLCFILLYLPSARSFASFSSRGLRYWPVKLPGTSATCSGVPSATMMPPALPPSGPRSMM